MGMVQILHNKTNQTKEPPHFYSFNDLFVKER